MASTPLDLEWGEDSQSQTELELLYAVAIADIPYPWNPTDPESEAYFAALESELALEELQDERLAGRAHKAIAQLDRLWSATETRSGDLEQLRTALSRQFGELVPHSWLEAIASEARSQLNSDRSLAERLVHCVTELLPQWTSEDLHVLARPFAYAMRGDSAASTVAAATQKTWTDLSQIEKARVSIAIARYALAQLEDTDA